MNEPQIVSFRDLSSQKLESVVAVYQQEFDVPWEWPAERVAGLARLTGDEGRFYRGLVLLEDGIPAGLAIVQYLPASNLLFLRYMTVDRASRNRGFGSRLLSEVGRTGEEMAQAAGEAGSLGTLMEVETPDALADPAELVHRKRRIAFYLRHGTLRPGIRFPRPPWAMPNMPDWELMVLPGLAWRGAIDAATAGGLVRALFVEGYGRSADEAWLQSFLLPLVGNGKGVV